MFLSRYSDLLRVLPHFKFDVTELMGIYLLPWGWRAIAMLRGMIPVLKIESKQTFFKIKLIYCILLLQAF